MASPHRSSLNKNGGVLGYENEEHAQILTAIRQPLFIQTPQQAMLESLVERMQTQASTITTFQEKISSLERTNLSQHELLDRLQVLESRLEVSHGTSSALSPFNQQEVLTRLQQLEQRADLMEQQAKQLKHTAEEELNSRLKTCECRLAGVHNLAGRLMAVDLVAAELGIAVPEPQLMTHQQLQHSQQQLQQQQHCDASLFGAITAPAADARSAGCSFSFATAAGGSQQQTGQECPGAAGSRPGSVALTASGNSTACNSLVGSSSIQQQQQLSFSGYSLAGDSSNPISRPQSAGVTAGVLTKSRQAELQQQIDRSQEQTAQMQQQLGGLQQQVQQLRADLSSGQDSSMGVLASLQDTCQGLADRLSQQVVQLRKEMQPALQQVKQAEVSLAVVAEMHGKLDTVVAAAAATSKELQQIKAKDLPALNSSLIELNRKVGRGTAAGVSDADKALAADLAGLREAVLGLAVRLDAQEAELLAREGVATKEDLQELSHLMVSKASKDDMRVVLGRAVELALGAYRSSVGDADSSGASKTRCLVCDRTLLGSRSSSPARDSTPGSSMAGAGSLPQFDAFRPSTASPAYNGPAATGETLGIGPLGPGLNAAQLRRMAEEKALGSNSSTGGKIGPGGSEQQQGGGQSGIGSLLGGSLVVRASSAGLTNSVKYSSPGPFNKKQQQQQQLQQQQGPGLAGSLRGHAHPHTTGGRKSGGCEAETAGSGLPQPRSAIAAARQRPATALGADKGRKQLQDEQQQTLDDQHVQLLGQSQTGSGKRNPIFV